MRMEIKMFVCIENNQVTSILNYQPNVPQGVEVVEITAAEDQLIKDGTHIFDVSTKTVKSKSAEELAKKQAGIDNIPHVEYLNSTDWMVLRHIRQQALGIPTSLTEEQYLDLEIKRQEAANSIIKL